VSCHGQRRIVGGKVVPSYAMLCAVSSLFVYASPREGAWSAENSVETLALGVGKTAAATTLTRRLANGPPVTAVVLVGVCGAFPKEHLIGAGEQRDVLDLCVVTREIFGDEGVHTPDGFLSVEDLGFGSKLRLVACERRSKLVIQRIGGHRSVGVTVSTCSGTDESSIERGKLGASVESMEGASVAHVCGVHGVPWVQLRCVSNYTGDRTPDRWRLDEALSTLAEATREISMMEGLD